MGSRIRLFWALALLVALFLVGLAGIRAAERGQRAREEARWLVAEALALRGQPGGEEPLFRRAQAAAPFYGVEPCERGMRLERQRSFAEAAVSYRVCAQADPRQAYAYLAYGETLLRGGGDDAEVRAALQQFLELVDGDAVAARDVAARQAAADLLNDLESLAEPRTRGGGPSLPSVEEIAAILLRDPRGPSRYEEPRLPLSPEFRPDDDVLSARAKEELRRVVRALQHGRLFEAEIQIEGFTDNLEGGTRAGRLALSGRRAESVKSFLVESGVSPKRLTVKRFGERYPLQSNDTEAGRRANRRVELVNLGTREVVRRDAREPG